MEVHAVLERKEGRERERPLTHIRLVHTQQSAGFVLGPVVFTKRSNNNKKQRCKELRFHHPGLRELDKEMNGMTGPGHGTGDLLA